MLYFLDDPFGDTNEIKKGTNCGAFLIFALSGTFTWRSRARTRDMYRYTLRRRSGTVDETSRNKEKMGKLYVELMGKQRKIIQTF